MWILLHSVSDSSDLHFTVCKARTERGDTFYYFILFILFSLMQQFVVDTIL